MNNAVHRLQKEDLGPRVVLPVESNNYNPVEIVTLKSVLVPSARTEARVKERKLMTDTMGVIRAQVRRLLCWPASKRSGLRSSSSSAGPRTSGDVVMEV